MSYDYSSESKRLELPNPHKVENIFLLVVGVIYFCAGLVVLFVTKGKLDAGRGLAFVAPLVVTVVLLALGIRFGAVALQQLRFFFGRGLPVGLAPELSPGVIGKSNAVDEVKEDIRRGTLNFPEPQGALNGLLYHRLPHLIVAPQQVQRLAQSQFRNGLVIALTTLSLLVAWLGFGRGAAMPWIGMFYFAFAAWLVVRPMTREDGNGEAGTAQAAVSETGIIALVLVAVLGPVAVGFAARSLPDVSWLQLQWQALFLLVSALASVGLYFLALLRQLSPPPSTNLSCEQLTLNINTQPAQILGEFDRVMQSRWTEKIPNRRYARIEPTVDANAKSGTFFGEVIEETQPLPSSVLQSLSLSSALASERTRWLVYLNFFGALLLAAGAIVLVLFAMKFEPGAGDYAQFSLVTFAFVAFTVGRFCFASAASLWGRFDFVSEIIWIELSGQFTTARSRLGNEFSSAASTENQSISIDAMTLRVWTTRIESVVFGKNKARVITAMDGQNEITKGLAQHLSDFARARTMFVAPNNVDDLQKIAAMQAVQPGAASAGLGMGSSPLQSLLAAQAAVSASESAAPSATINGPIDTPIHAPIQPVTAVATSSKFCPECGASNPASAKFCVGCGAKFG